VSVSLVLSFEVIRFVTLFVCISLFIDPPIAPPLQFFSQSLILSLIDPPIEGGRGIDLTFRTCLAGYEVL